MGCEQGRVSGAKSNRARPTARLDITDFVYSGAFCLAVRYKTVAGRRVVRTLAGTARLINKFTMKRQNAAIDPPFCAEATRLIFCLDYYLDPYYVRTAAQKSEIFALLRELLLTERSQAIRGDF